LSDVLDGGARQRSAGVPRVEPGVDLSGPSGVDLSGPSGVEVDRVPSRPRAGGHPMRKAASRSAPKWEVEARQRIRDAVRGYTRPLADLIARDANEGDTRLLVTDFLCDVLGYDKYGDLTTEYRVRGEYADFGLRIDQQLVAFVEVKRCTTRLNARHLRQVELYAVNEGVEWMILTNGQVWQIWHLTAGLPVSIDLALEVDLLSNESPSVKADGLFFLAKESLKRRQVDDLWRAKAATSPQALGEVLVSDAVLDEIRKELRRRTGHNVGPKDLRELLLNNVVRPEALTS
jgi:hypothetical protein